MATEENLDRLTLHLILGNAQSIPNEFFTKIFTGRKSTRNNSSRSHSSESSRLSTQHVENILNRLLTRQNRSSTSRTYMRIWRQFNNFVISLDRKPVTWEERAMLFVAHLIDRGLQSSTVRSYISAIKKVLVEDAYAWNDTKILLTSLTKACWIVNDQVQT